MSSVAPIQESPLDDLPVTYLVMDATAHTNLYRAEVFGKAIPDLAHAVHRARSLAGVVVKVRDRGDAYLAASIVLPPLSY